MHQWRRSISVLYMERDLWRYLSSWCQATGNFFFLSSSRFKIFTFSWFLWYIFTGYIYIYISCEVTFMNVSEMLQGILINGQFPGPQITSVTNENLIVSVFNSLNEPFLLSWSVLLMNILLMLLFLYSLMKFAVEKVGQCFSIFCLEYYCCAGLDVKNVKVFLFPSQYLEIAWRFFFFTPSCDLVVCVFKSVFTGFWITQHWDLNMCKMVKNVTLFWLCFSISDPCRFLYI